LHLSFFRLGALALQRDHRNFYARQIGANPRVE